MAPLTDRSATRCCPSSRPPPAPIAAYAGAFDMLATTNKQDPRGGTVAPLAVAVAIPTLNEASSIGEVVGGIPRDLVRHVIVADGGSTDATAALAEAAGAQVITAGRGYGRACWCATEAASDTDVMVFMDGDGADDPLG